MGIDDSFRRFAIFFFSHAKMPIALKIFVIACASVCVSMCVCISHAY